MDSLDTTTHFLFDVSHQSYLKGVKFMTIFGTIVEFLGKRFLWWWNQNNFPRFSNAAQGHDY